MNLLIKDYNWKDWSIRGVGLMKYDALMHDAMTTQDCLYTVVEHGIEDARACVVGHITACMYALDGPRLVSTTILMIR